MRAWLPMLNPSKCEPPVSLGGFRLARGWILSKFEGLLARRFRQPPHASHNLLTTYSHTTSLLGLTRAGVVAFLSTHTHTRALWSAASLSVNGYIPGNYQETTRKLPGNEVMCVLDGRAGRESELLQATSTDAGRVCRVVPACALPGTSCRPSCSSF